MSVTHQSFYLKNIATFLKGKPPAIIPYYEEDACLYLSPEFLRGKDSAELAKPSSNSVFVEDGDLIVLWDGSNAGEFFKGRRGLLASTMSLIQHGDEIDKQYFLYALKLWESYLKGQTSGSGIPHVDKEVLGNLRILVFCKEEQEKIAKVLSTIDRAIAQIEAIIAKQQRIKTGLMQDLLTKGIDENGNIRSESTHEFKDSAIGRIPVEWEAKTIEELLSNVQPSMRSGTFGSALLKEELVESGIPVLGIDNVHVEKFVSQYSRFVTTKKAEQLSRYYVRPDDIMITIMGTVGRCCVVPLDVGSALSSKHVYTISLDKKQYSSQLACLQINYAPWVLAHFSRDEQGGIMSAIRSETLRSTYLPVPPREEIRKIDFIFTEISTLIAKEKINLAKRIALKTGLMQNLLTGEVSITNLLKEKAAGN